MDNGGLRIPSPSTAGIAPPRNAFIHSRKVRILDKSITVINLKAIFPGVLISQLLPKLIRNAKVDGWNFRYQHDSVLVSKVMVMQSL